MKTFFLTIGLTTLILAIPAEAARPSSRDLRSNAYNLKEERTQIYTKKPVAKMQAFNDIVMGIRGEYPSDWTKRTSVTRRKSSIAPLMFTSPAYQDTSITVEMKLLDHDVTMEDLKKDFAELSKQPENDYQFLNTKFIHNFKLIEEKNGTCNGKNTLENSYEYTLASKNLLARQVRFGNGNRLYIVQQIRNVQVGSTTKELDSFLQALQLDEKKVSTSSTSPSRTRRR